MYAVDYNNGKLVYSLGYMRNIKELQIPLHNPLFNLHVANDAGATMFDSRIYPRKYRNRELLFLPERRSLVQKYFPNALQGLQCLTRRDSGYYPAYIHDGEYVKDALAAEATLREINGLLDAHYGVPAEVLEAASPVQEYPEYKSETDILLADMGLEVSPDYHDGLPQSSDAEIENMPQTLDALPPDILPAAQHAMITLGILHRLKREELPYSEDFGFDATRYWGPELTIDRIRLLVEHMGHIADVSLTPSRVVANEKLLPVAQFFQVGSQLTNDLMKKVYNY